MVHRPRAYAAEPPLSTPRWRSPGTTLRLVAIGLTIRSAAPGRTPDPFGRGLHDSVRIGHSVPRPPSRSRAGSCVGRGSRTSPPWEHLHGGLLSGMGQDCRQVYISVRSVPASPPPVTRTRTWWSSRGWMMFNSPSAHELEGRGPPPCAAHINVANDQRGGQSWPTLRHRQPEIESESG